MHRLGIEHLSVFGLPPVQFVNLAADLGCSCIATGLVGVDFNPHNYPAYSLRDDIALRREMKAAMRDRGITISLAEGCNVRAGQDIRAAAADMDIMKELGAERLNVVSLDPDLGRSVDQLAIFAEMVGERGMVSTIEMCPVLTIKDLITAVAAVRHVGRKDFRLLLDTMHLGRSGATPADIAALDPALIDYVQLCDINLEPPANTHYFVEASLERKIPGEGELPLREYLAAMPGDVTISLEVPLRSLAEAGVPPEVRMQRCLDATRRLLSKVDKH
jgi:sugar phosphate isomerase/epimerase